MSAILLFLQHENAKIIGATLNALSAARAIQQMQAGSEIYTLALGPGAKSASETILGYGVKQAFFSEAKEFERYLAGAYAPQIVKLAKEKSAKHIIFGSTSNGKDLAPRVAGILDAAQASEVLAINADGTFKRPLFAGNLFADVELTTEVKVLTIRTTAFPVASGTQNSGSIAEFVIQALDSNIGQVLGYEVAKAERPELTEAKVVISGGRALGSAEKFKEVLYPLADKLGAAIGASRAAVDSGYAPNDWQVGQTGKVVAPQLYFAIGISGQIQHLAGMKDSKTIVAINKNPDEPIFQVADYGLVADLFQAVPALVEELKKS